MVQAKYLSPADIVIEELGGVRPTARALSVAPGTVCAWRNKRGKGVDGLIPSVHLRQILRLAREESLNISALDLIEGRLVPKKRA